MKDLLKTIDNKYVRLAAFLIATANGAAKMAGYELLPFESDEIVLGVSIAGIIVTGIWVYWKNNSFTDMAKNADKWLDSMKKELKEQYEEYQDTKKGNDK